MARLVLEGTWEEIAAHAEELAGKRIKVIVETEAISSVPTPNYAALDAMREADEIQQGMNPKPANLAEASEIAESPNVGPTNLGPPNEKMLGILRDIAERQKGRPYTKGDSVAIVRYGRSGPMYGMPYVDDMWIQPDDEQPAEHE